MNNITDPISIQSYTLDELIPDRNEVLTSMGIEKGIAIPDDVQFLCKEAMKLFKELSRPKGMIKFIKEKDFLEILEGEGYNEPGFPLQVIVKKANRMALFAFTLGEPLSQKIQKLIREKDYPLGYMLDIIASRSVEQATIIQEKRFIENIGLAANQKALLYSPGYCGWHITAQKKIFRFLEPEKISISLNESSLMIPIKSVSGVLISGMSEIHNFKNNFDFCRDCTTFTCRERIRQ